jgi:hypothetical protein
MSNRSPFILLAGGAGSFQIIRIESDEAVRLAEGWDCGGLEAEPKMKSRNDLRLFWN